MAVARQRVMKGSALAFFCEGALTACLLHLGNCSSERIHARNRFYFFLISTQLKYPVDSCPSPSLNRHVQVLFLEWCYNPTRVSTRRESPLTYVIERAAADYWVRAFLFSRV